MISPQPQGRGDTGEIPKSLQLSCLLHLLTISIKNHILMQMNSQV